jgi:KDO2-lipid IV(A) lauroyltransferase
MRQRKYLKILKVIIRLWSRLPLSWSQGMGRILGRLWQAFDKRHREVVQRNLRLAFPEKDPVWIKATAKACFENIAMIACEIPYLLYMPMEELLRLTRFHDLQYLLAAQEQGKGIIGLTGHIGNWEWCNVLLGAAGYHGTIVARPLDNPILDKLVNQWRGRSGQIIVGKEATARILFRALKSGRGVAILLDQNTDWYEGIWVNIFDRPASTSHGLAQLAIHTKAPVIPIYCFRAADGTFDIFCHKPLPTASNGDRTNDIWDNTQQYNDILEKIIRRQPAQWLWQHRRWKDNYCPWPKEEL